MTSDAMLCEDCKKKHELFEALAGVVAVVFIAVTLAIPFALGYWAGSADRERAAQKNEQIWQACNRGTKELPAFKSDVAENRMLRCWIEKP